jgi:hypothetical protein
MNKGISIIRFVPVSDDTKYALSNQPHSYFNPECVDYFIETIFNVPYSSNLYSLLKLFSSPDNGSLGLGDIEGLRNEVLEILSGKVKDYDFDLNSVYVVNTLTFLYQNLSLLVIRGLTNEVYCKFGANNFY